MDHVAQLNAVGNCVYNYLPCLYGDDYMAIKHYLKNPLLYISLIVVLVALFLGAQDSINWYYQNLKYLSGNVPSDVNLSAVQRSVDLFSGYDVFVNGIGFGNYGFYSILVMLVVGFLFTGSYAQRLSDGSGIAEILRIGYSKYHRKEVLHNFVATFAFATVALFVFLVMCISLFTSTSPTKGFSSPIITATDLYYDMPLLYCIAQILNQSLFLAMFSLLCMGTVSLYSNTFINRMSPLIVYLFLTVASQLLYRFLGISWFVLILPDLIFVPFNVEGGTKAGFIGEKICAYILLVTAIAAVHCYMYRKYRANYLK